MIVCFSNLCLDMGVLRVELLDGKELAAADRSGRLDTANVLSF